MQKCYALTRSSGLDVKWAGFFNLDHQFLQTHTNPYYNLFLVSSGPVYLQTGEEQHTLNTFDFMLLEPWEQHCGWKKPQSSDNAFWVQFSADPALDEILEWKTYFKNISSFIAGPDLRTAEHDVDYLILPRRHQVVTRYRLMLWFEELVEILNKPTVYFRFRASTLLSQMLESIAYDFLEKQQINLAVSNSYKTFRKLVDYLNEFYNYQEKITKEAIEERMERNYDYLSQLFKKYASLSIVKYVQKLRIQRACHLLKQSDLTVQSIAEAVGMSDPFYFSTTFKNHIGTPPTEYRQQNRNHE